MSMSVVAFIVAVRTDFTSLWIVEITGADSATQRAGWTTTKHKPLTAAELTEIRLRVLERQQAEHDKRLSTLEKMHGMMHVAEFYHGNLAVDTNNAFEYWLSEGMHVETIDTYKLGYCSRCKTDKDRRPSYTIPVIIAGKLYNIRHRLVGADNGDKYRPEIAGLPSVLFNADYLYGDSETMLIVEGEKKSIITAQTGYPNVGIMGKTGFNNKWVKKFDRFKLVNVALDPDAEKQAIDLAAKFGGRGRIIQLPEKIDDMITKYGATRDDIEWFIRQGYPV